MRVFHYSWPAKAITVLSTGCLREARYANRYEVSPVSEVSVKKIRIANAKSSTEPAFRINAILYASVPFTGSPLLRNFRGESQTDPMCASRQSHVSTNLLTRLETWRPLPSHNSNSFALLWSEYMSNSKLVTSVVFLSRELKLPRLPRVSQGYVLLTTLITQWTKQPAK